MLRSKRNDPPPTETQTTDIEGVLLADKPAGITSHDVVSIIRRATGVRRVGHAGTLDPFATGLLVVLIGRATRLLPYLEGEPKVYDATIRFGTETDTDDCTGQSTRSAAMPAQQAVGDTIAHLTGALAQVPPAYSAKQVDGTRAYVAARRGTPIELPPVRVFVHSWRINDRAQADLAVTVTCSAGTYIRALARDLGRLSGSAAHLAALRRVSSGPFSVHDASTIDDIRAGRAAVRPLLEAVPSLPVQTLAGDELSRVLHGNSISDKSGAPRVALVDYCGALVAIAADDGGILRPKLVLRDA